MVKIDVIPLLPLLRLNYCQLLLHMSKILVCICAIVKRINSFSIGYMINTILHVNKVFREQVENFVKATFHKNTMEGIKIVMRKNGICVIALIKFYETKINNSIKV